VFGVQLHAVAFSETKVLEAFLKRAHFQLLPFALQQFWHLLILVLVALREPGCCDSVDATAQALDVATVVWFQKGLLLGRR
jgi:hypothetical protein